jgi:CRP/FNR family transcriptional regulator
MISQEQTERALDAFSILARADPALLREFKQATYFAILSPGKDVFVEGDRAGALALVLSGVVRVYRIGPTGREITLYRIRTGESCILTANAILSYQAFPAIATCEQAVEAVMIPADFFRIWVRRHDLWREFFFGLLSLRLMEVLTLVDEVVFRRMDARVASFLQHSSRIRNPIFVTHQEIAADLGSSREVISRILGGLAASGIIRTGRGAIEVIDFDGLDALCGS